MKVGWETDAFHDLKWMADLNRLIVIIVEFLIFSNGLKSHITFVIIPKVSTNPRDSLFLG